VSDLPVALPGELEPAFVRAFDPSAKLVAALDALGPVADRDVVVVDATGGPVVDGLAAAGARLRFHPLSKPLRLDAPDASADVVIGLWSAFRGVDRRELAEVDRVLRPGGRHLVVHDYGRDDVSRLHGDRPEYGGWSQRNGPFLAGGFRVRVLHCFWEFDSAADLTTFLTSAFGAVGASVAASLKRPRLSYNVAVYHRSRS
jgi:SAM-dependent methyltransferase